MSASASGTRDLAPAGDDSNPPIVQTHRRNMKPSSSWALAMEAFEGREVLKAAAREGIFEVKKETVLLGSVEPEIWNIT
ncbi:hypothetical protein [uncultured Cohaesibacter sp.]|uniref:hypothetical protein n=1 Tax=uncultured Cohaesibacter sp. TaxID=1002546 RepID=UPI002AA67787|nr:hypothetical protein [uncultured Cohaesibacter sp.]